jgi:hypothetical protein
MIDVLLIETLSGGDISIEANTLVADTKTSNIIYLALFGGNVGQKTRVAKSGEFREYYWGNDFTLYGDSRMDSGFEDALRTVSLTSGARIKLEAIATQDLKCLLKYYSSYTVRITMVKEDYIRINILIVTKEGQSIEKIYGYKKGLIVDYDSEDYDPLDYSTEEQ